MKHSSDSVCKMQKLQCTNLFTFPRYTQMFWLLYGCCRAWGPLSTLDSAQTLHVKSYTVLVWNKVLTLTTNIMVPVCNIRACRSSSQAVSVWSSFTELFAQCDFSEVPKLPTITDKGLLGGDHIGVLLLSLIVNTIIPLSTPGAYTCIHKCTHWRIIWPV